MKNEFEQMKEEFNQMKEEHKQIKQVVSQTKKLFKRINQEINQTKEKLENAKQELNQTKEEFKQRQNMFKQFILVGGLNSDNRLGEIPNNKSVDGNSFISPPLKSSLDPFSLLSYSVYYHSVIITKRYSLQGIGDNCKGAICKALEKAEVGQFTEFSIRDERISQLVPVSAVTTAYGTLYMFSNSNGSMKQLIYCDEGIDGGMPVFLNIENQLPIALFGGFSYVAAISNEGKIIFINRWSIKYSPQSSIAAISLPNGDKASSIALCNDSIIALSSSGKLFSSCVAGSSTSLEFSIVEELKNEDIINLSGTYYHCLAVNKEGIVFALGANEDGQLGIGQKIESVSSFMKISLEGYKISEVYAGVSHSLFKTKEGQILSCGSNKYGQLFLKEPCVNVFQPTETTITGGATFCVAGSNLSVIFVGIDPPPNIPNKKIHYY